MSKSWLEQTYPDQDVSKITTFRPAAGSYWHEILLYDDQDGVVGNLGIVFAKLAEEIEEGVHRVKTGDIRP